MARKPARKRKTVVRAGAAPSPKNANRSVGVGLTILKAISDLGRSGTLSEIARAAQMPASRTHRFLAGMIQYGAVRQDPASGRYDLGPMLVSLGVAALGRIDGVKLATEALHRLTEKTGFVSVLTIWSANGPTVIRWEHGELAAAMRIREGRNLSLLRTASGKVFLAFLPEEKTRAIADAELASPAHRASPSSLRTMTDVRRLAQQVSEERLADNAHESDAGINGLAAPVFGADGKIAFAITLIGVSGFSDFRHDGPAAAALREVANSVSRSLGARVPEGAAATA